MDTLRAFVLLVNEYPLTFLILGVFIISFMDKMFKGMAHIIYTLRLPVRPERDTVDSLTES